MEYIPQHINATSASLSGNQGIGRYIFLTGSDQRASEISEHFSQTVILKHPRQHNLYLGTLPSSGGNLDVAAISTGMGGSSADIILFELIKLGAQRLLRVGTAGSMQPDRIHLGDTVIATAAVRDDKASWDYIYKEYPAIASMEYMIAAKRAHALNPKPGTHFGIVHSKSSLYAREFNYSFMQPENEQYMAAMQRSGVLASEMECAQLYILKSLMSEQISRELAKNYSILCGCFLAIVGDSAPFSNETEAVTAGIYETISLAIETTKQLAMIDQNKLSVF